MLVVNKETADDRYRRTIVQMMQGHAYRELAAARMFGFGLRYVPEPRWGKLIRWHIREELDHYDRVVRMYSAFTGEDVRPLVEARMRSRPIATPASWYELAMAQFLYDRGGYWQLREYEECSFAPYRGTVQSILEDERGHQELGERIVVELTATGAFEDRKQAVFETWLREGLLSFGRPGTEASRYAVEVGLKKRDGGEVMQDFMHDIEPAVARCGLLIPPLDRIGIVAPAALDASGASSRETAA
jgi:1,2-phenylacetyl-CoA epoxidase catalytic subunit